jgi:hypothetical protein
MAGRHQSEQVADFSPESLAEIVGIRSRATTRRSSDPVGLGAPADPRNLWPEPRISPDGWGAGRKDEVEFALNQLVCSGRLPLREAQRAIATNWIAA